MADAQYEKLGSEKRCPRLQARVPIISWLSTYDMKYFITDLTAGVSLGTMCLAQTMAHATIATTEPIQGEASGTNVAVILHDGMYWLAISPVFNHNRMHIYRILQGFCR